MLDWMFSRSEFKTTTFLFTGMVLFGSATPLSKLVVEQFPIFTASLFRVVVGALVVLPFVRRGTVRVHKLNRRDWIVE